MASHLYSEGPTGTYMGSSAGSEAASPPGAGLAVGSPTDSVTSQASPSLAGRADTAPQTSSDTDKPATKVSRKRTKTGCLTCRKRRIKCGEERPTCNNCIKSKRVCEGYNQRVIFKDGLFRPGAGRQGLHFAIQPAPGSGLQPIAPAPPHPHSHPHHSHSHPHPPPPAYREDPITPLDTQMPPHLRMHYDDRGHTQQYQVPGVTVPLGPHSADAYVTEFRKDDGHYGAVSSGGSSGGSGYYTAPGSATTATFSIPGTHHEPGSSSAPTSASLYGPPPFQASAHHPQYSAASAFMPAHPSAATNTNSCPFNPPLDPKYSLAGGDHMVQPAQEFQTLFSRNIRGSGVADGTHRVLGPEDFARLAEQVGHDYDDDMDSDDDDDDEEDEDEYAAEADDKPYTFNPTTQEPSAFFFPGLPEAIHAPQALIQRPPLHHNGFLQPHAAQSARLPASFRSLLPDTAALAAYQPTFSSSPLMNPTTAKIFCHFVYVLGPTISIFERYAPDPPSTFSTTTPGARNVWTYVLPMLSLQHPPLLHSILALSALHISKLQKGPAHPSMLHYHIALRRLGKAIASDKHRAHVATLAATLILAYYETMAAEHDKWSSHVHGAKQLLKEIDFARVKQRVEELNGDDVSMDTGTDVPLPSFQLAQRRRQREEQGKWKGRDTYPLPGQKEQEHYQLQADMFWWFLKMDCFQSILSGCPLVLDYVHWSQCPPRASISNTTTVCGASDNFFLLLGRLADFGVRDLKRKKAVVRANGGVWIPPPDMGGPPPDAGRGGGGRGRGRGRPRGRGGRGRGAPPAGPPPPGGPPGMPPLDSMPTGMVPLPPGQPRLSKAFTENAASLRMSPPRIIAPPDAANIADADLPAATGAALAEWADIAAALDAFYAALPPEKYAPLQLEMALPPTPFDGPPIYYRDYSVATLQMNILMARLILARSHPAMPPVAMLATAVAAPRTTPVALAVGRILAGLTATSSDSSSSTSDPRSASTPASAMGINPALASALVESVMPIFFAGVQYADPPQRDWTVAKMREIRRLCGWATASRVAMGCQRAWQRQSEAGKGPRYVRPSTPEEIKPREGTVLGDADKEAFVWKVAGQMTITAAGILGDAEEVRQGLAAVNLG